MQNFMEKKYIEQKIEDTEKEVAILQKQVIEFSEKLNVAHKALRGLRDFYQFEFQKDTTKEVSDMMDIKDTQRFVDMTIRKACGIILKEHGPLHVGEIHPILKEGGREVKKTSIVSILIRAKEFERVSGKENTWKLKEDIEEGQ